MAEGKCPKKIPKLLALSMLQEMPMFHQNPPLSYFFSSTISQPKIKIKIPRVLAKTMQRRGNGCTDANTNHTKNRKKWAKPGNLVRKKVISVFSCDCGNKESPVAYSKLQSNDEIDKSDLEEAEADLPCGVAPQSPLHRCYSLKQLLQMEDEEEEQKRAKMEKRPNKPSMADKSSKVSLSFSSFFQKIINLNFIRNKINKADAINNISTRGSFNYIRCNTSSNCVGTVASDTVVGTQGSSVNLPRLPSIASSIGMTNTAIERQESSGNLHTVPSRRLSTCPKLMARSLRNMTSRCFAGKSEKDDKEEGRQRR